MCDPVSMGLLAAGSAAVTGLSAANQAQAQKTAAAYQAQVDANNAVMAGQQRSAALQAGERQAQQSEMHAAQVLGQQRAGLAANGVDLGSGSAIDQLATTKFLNAQDVNAIESNAARQAWGYSVDASNYQAQAGLAKWQAGNINPFGIGAMAGGGSLLSSASTYAMNNKGK